MVKLWHGCAVDGRLILGGIFSCDLRKDDRLQFETLTSANRRHLFLAAAAPHRP